MAGNSGNKTAVDGLKDIASQLTTVLMMPGAQPIAQQIQKLQGAIVQLVIQTQQQATGQQQQMMQQAAAGGRPGGPGPGGPPPPAGAGGPPPPPAQSQAGLGGGQPGFNTANPEALKQLLAATGQVS